MRHRISIKKLSKTPAHRKVMIKNMLIALYRHEKINTTFAKSKVLKQYAERLITRSKIDSVHNRRVVAKWIHDKKILNKLFTEIGPRFSGRPGGYTRTVKLGPRYGDATEMVIISLVENNDEKSLSNSKKKNTSNKKITKEKTEQKKELINEENSGMTPPSLTNDTVEVQENIKSDIQLENTKVIPKIPNSKN